MEVIVMNKLIIFKRADYQKLKKSYEKKGMKLVGFTQVYNLTKSEWRTEDFDNVVIDISELGEIESVNSAFLPLFLNMIQTQFSDGVFITDHSNTEFKEKVGYVFSVEEYESSTTEKREEAETNDKNLITTRSAKEIEKLTKEFEKKLVGHDQFKDDLYKNLIEFKIFNSMGENKVLSLFLMGESGVGKSEVAQLLHKLLGGKKPIAKINFGNYSSQGALNSLIGSPRGYIGSETGEFFEKVNRSDTGVILLDEFEKSTTEVNNFFLEVLETGKATSMAGEVIDVSGFIFVFASNIAKINFEHKYSSELRSRFNYISSFNPLTLDNKKNYLFTRFSRYVEKFNKQYKKRLVTLSQEELENNIDVQKYNNMRILNRAISDLFMRHVKNKYPENDKVWK